MIEKVFVGGILFVLDNESFLSDFFISVMKNFQLMLSIRMVYTSQEASGSCQSTGEPGQL